MVQFVDKSDPSPKTSGLIAGATERAAIANSPLDAGQLIGGAVKTLKAWNNRGFGDSYWDMEINDRNKFGLLSRQWGLQGGDFRSKEFLASLKKIQKALDSESLQIHLHDDETFNKLKSDPSINRPEPKSAIPIVNWMRAASRMGKPKRPMVVHMPKSDLADQTHGAHNFIRHFAPAVLNMSEQEARQLADLVLDNAWRDRPVETQRRVDPHQERAGTSTVADRTLLDQLGTSRDERDPPPSYADAARLSGSSRPPNAVSPPQLGTSERARLVRSRAGRERGAIER